MSFNGLFLGIFPHSFFGLLIHVFCSLFPFNVCFCTKCLFMLFWIYLLLLFHQLIKYWLFFSIRIVFYLLECLHVICPTLSFLSAFQDLFRVLLWLRWLLGRIFLKSLLFWVRHLDEASLNVLLCFLVRFHILWSFSVFSNSNITVLVSFFSKSWALL